MSGRYIVVAGAAVAALLAVCVAAYPDPFSCQVRACVESGCMCGSTRWAEGGAVYATFLGVPYAKQPLGPLRFKELEPAEPWHLLDATQEGPSCDQTDILYGRLVQPRGFSEACIHANVHVPLGKVGGRFRRLAPPFSIGLVEAELPLARGLPVLVFVHGGGFQSGSGDPDLHGPEYLVTKNVIVITFNYRLNVFGFLSLNSSEIPGNQGLRDQVTLLRWVQRNARAFGGDPDNVTLMGQSAGAASVHLLTLSKATEGLFKRAFLMSGAGSFSFFSTSPTYTQQATGLLLKLLSINATAPAEEIHQQLIEIPIEKIHEANKYMLTQFGLTTFVPSIESEFPGVTRILDDDPQVLLAQGRGKDVPLVIGFTSVECEVFRPSLEQFQIAAKIMKSPTFTVPLDIMYSTKRSMQDVERRIIERYYNGSVSTDGFIRYCTEGLYKYPALKLAQTRAAAGGAPTYLYQFSYDGDHSVLKEVLGIGYKGAAHAEDLTYMFRVNSVLKSHYSFPPRDRDDYMKDWLTMFVTRYMHCSDSVCQEKTPWPPLQPGNLQLQDIQEPGVFRQRDLTEEEQDILKFFDSLIQK